MAVAMAVSTSAYANDDVIEEVTVTAKPTSYANNVIEPAMLEQIGRASCRERVLDGV